MIDLDALLAREGLSPRLRLHALCALATGRGDREAQARVIARARALGLPRSEFEETLLQCVLFFGFPRVVTAFDVASRQWPAESPPAGGALPPAEQRAAGTALFDRIYGRNASAVHAMLRGFHAEFHDFVLEAAYGRVLARPGLPPLDRELIAVAALAALDQVPQLIAHARGARTFGATALAIRETLVTALGDQPAVDELMQRIG